MINDDQIVGFQTVASRMELLLQDSWGKFARLSEEKVKARAQVMDSIARYTTVLNKAVDQLGECKRQINGSVRVTQHFTMARLDQMTMAVLLCHMLTLSLWSGTKNASHVDYMEIFFCCVYTAEMSARLKAANSWSRFSRDPRGGMFSFRNKISFVLWIISLCSLGIGLAITSDEYQRFWSTLSSLVVWRIFCVIPAFRDLCYSVTRGLGTVCYLLSVFMILSYGYAYAAYILFKSVEFDDENISFSTFPKSCMTIAQVWLGEGYVSQCVLTTYRAHRLDAFPGGMRLCTTPQIEPTKLLCCSLVHMRLPTWSCFLNY